MPVASGVNSKAGGGLAVTSFLGAAKRNVKSKLEIRSRDVLFK